MMFQRLLSPDSPDGSHSGGGSSDKSAQSQKQPPVKLTEPQELGAPRLLPLEARAIIERHAPLLAKLSDQEQLPKTAQSLAEYAQGAAQRENAPAEAALLESLIGAFGSRPYGLRASFQLTEHFALLRPSTEQFLQISRIVSKISGDQKTTALRGALEAMNTLCPSLPSVKSWRALLEVLTYTSRSKGSVLHALRATSSWSGTPPIGSESAARAAFFGYALSRRAEKRQLPQLAATRPAYSSPLADYLRTLSLQAETHPDTYSRPEELRLALRTITAFEKLAYKDSSILPDANAIAKSFSNDPIALRRFYRDCASERESELGTKLTYAANLVRAGASVSYLPFTITSLLGTLLEKSGEDPQQIQALSRLATALSSFTMRMLQEGESDGWPSRLRNVVARIVGAQSDDERLAPPANLRTIIFDGPDHIRKACLVLQGHGLPEQSRISSLQELEKFVIELTAHAYISEMLVTSDDKRREQLELAFPSNAVAGADNPPFSILSPENQPRLARFNEQVLRVFKHQIDSYYGFWAHTHTFRHSPLSRRCPFDEFALRIAGQDRLQILPAADINQLPGRGRVLRGFLPERVFATDPLDAQRNPFHRWKTGILKEFGVDNLSSAGRILHPLDYASETTFVFLRLQRAIIPPDLREFSYAGEHLTRVEYNHHYDSSGITHEILVPTRVYRTFIDPFAVPYDPSPETFSTLPQGENLCAYPPTVANLAKRCKEMGTAVGVINLGSGSNIGGGLCNGFAPKSSPHHEWEQVKQHRIYLDNFGHSHKWHIASRQDILAKLLRAHEELYTVFMNFENLLNLYKAAESIDACGFSIPQGSLQRRSEASGAPLGELEDLDPWALELPDFSTREDEERREGYTPEFVLEDLSLTGLSAEKREQRERLFGGRTLRKLEEISRLAFENRAKGIPKSEAPILVLADGFSYAQTPDTPFVIDSGSGMVWRRSGPPLIFDRIDGEIPDEVQDWWLREVAPKLIHNPFFPPRVVARENYLEQMREMGASV
jgi:hypothetical protein